MRRGPHLEESGQVDAGPADGGDGAVHRRAAGDKRRTSAGTRLAKAQRRGPPVRDWGGSSPRDETGGAEGDDRPERELQLVGRLEGLGDRAGLVRGLSDRHHGSEH